MIETINFNNDELNDIKKYIFTKDCYESTTHPYVLNGEKKVIKIFKPDILDVIDINKKIKKIKLIKERTEGLDFITTADFFVKNNDRVIGYGMPYIKGKEINYSSGTKAKTNIPILKQLREKLKILHSLNIVYADFNHNFLIKEDGKIVLIDSDNIKIDNLDIDIKDNILKKYLKRVETLDSKYDDYMLNLFTIGVLSHITPYTLTRFGANKFDKWPEDKELENIVYNTLDFTSEYSAKTDRPNEYNEKLIVDLINDKKDYKKIRRMAK